MLDERLRSTYALEYAYLPPLHSSLFIISKRRRATSRRRLVGSSLKAKNTTRTVLKLGFVTH